MANNLTSNITEKVLKEFIPEFEKQRVLSKTVNTRRFQGKHTPDSGDTVRVKRPHRYASNRTADGDISAVTKNSLTSGTALSLVQDYITVALEWENLEEALALNQLSEILKPAAEECVTTLETSLCDFMIANAGLSVGVPGNPINTWEEMSVQMALMKSIGCPMGEIHSVVNPFTIAKLAGAQTGLTAADQLVKSAWELAQIATPFAGLKVVGSNSLSTYVNATSADQAGTLSATPTATYVAAKDTMTQTLTLAGLTADAEITAGTVIEFPGTGALARNYVHMKTRKTIFDGDGLAIPWRCVVTEDATMSGAGAGTVVVAGAAIYEAAPGQYNNISAPLTSGDVFNILGATATEYQPDLFYHKEAFAIDFVKIPKLFSTDTTAETSDGIVIRCCKYADGDANTQKIRFDLLPAFGVMDPFMAGKAFGAP